MVEYIDQNATTLSNPKYEIESLYRGADGNWRWFDRMGSIRGHRVAKDIEEMDAIIEEMMAKGAERIIVREVSTIHDYVLGED